MQKALDMQNLESTINLAKFEARKYLFSILCAGSLEFLFPSTQEWFRIV
jgi:hypothetical protein